MNQRVVVEGAISLENGGTIDQKGSFGDLNADFIEYIFYERKPESNTTAHKGHNCRPILRDIETTRKSSFV